MLYGIFFSIFLVFKTFSSKTLSSDCPYFVLFMLGHSFIEAISSHSCSFTFQFALEENQRYKESHVILEKALIREKDGFLEDVFTA